MTQRQALSKMELAKLWTDVKASKRWQTLMSEAGELDKLAAPLYKEMLSSIPFYQERMHDEHFWSQFIGSRVNEARYLVKQHEARSTAVV